MNLPHKSLMLISSLLHGALCAATSVRRTMRHAARQMEREVATAREGVAKVSGELFLVQKDADDASSAAARFGELASQHNSNGQRDMAIEAVQQQVRYEVLAEIYAANYRRLKPYLESLLARLDELNRQKAEADSQFAMLSARSELTRAEIKAARSLGGIGAAGDIDVAQLTHKVDCEVASAAAMTDLATVLAMPAPDEQLRMLARQERLQCELATHGLQVVGQPQTVARPGGTHHD